MRRDLTDEPEEIVIERSLGDNAVDVLKLPPLEVKEDNVESRDALPPRF
jgi:hypothetical protein